MSSPSPPFRTVAAHAADQQVIAHAAGQGVVAAKAEQGVVTDAARDLLPVLGAAQLVIVVSAINRVRQPRNHLRHRHRVSALVDRSHVAGIGAGADVISAADFRDELG